jgi:hypothetical protein
VWNCERGDPNAILAEAQMADLSHVLIKVADGSNTYNYDKQRRIDLAAPVVRLLKNQGMQVWGWQYVRGDDSLSEARKAIQRINELSLDGFVVNAEVEYKQPGKDVAARKYMSELRNALPDMVFALSSYRFPAYHPQFPFRDFLNYCDYNMPQVYWQGAHNPAAQLTKSVREFQNMQPSRPVIPTGSAYAYGGWQPTADDIQNFLQTAKQLGLSAANFWSWDYCRQHLPHLWDKVRDFPWPSTPAAKDIVEQYIEALNARDPLRLATMYSPDGVHINATRTVQGPEKILTWYNTFLNQLFPNASFKLTGYSGVGNSRHFTWEGTSSIGNILNGNDTFGLREGKITYHYTYFTIIRKNVA